MSGLSSRGLPSSASCPALADIDSHPASRALPVLYLGNSRDAADLTCLQDLGTTCVLNVTFQLPGYHENAKSPISKFPQQIRDNKILNSIFRCRKSSMMSCNEFSEDKRNPKSQSSMLHEEPPFLGCKSSDSDQSQNSYDNASRILHFKNI